MTAFTDTAENFHPFECNGPGKCCHCDRRIDEHHDPATCALCDPEYDHAANDLIEAAKERKEER